jgi:hypothetical protein
MLKHSNIVSMSWKKYAVLLQMCFWVVVLEWVPVGRGNVNLLSWKGRRHGTLTLKLRGGSCRDNIGTADLDEADLRHMHYALDKDTAAMSSR